MAALRESTGPAQQDPNTAARLAEEDFRREETSYLMERLVLKLLAQYLLPLDKLRLPELQLLDI